LFRQAFRGFERTAEFAGDVLSVDENPLVLAQEFRLRFADGFEVSDAHESKSKIRSSKCETMTNDE
jgi:hypothetical protein